MAYASEFMTALREQALAGLFVQNYFLSDKVLNSMQFNNGAVNATANGMSYTVVHTEKVTGKGSSRNWGADYNTVNSNPVPETFYLGVLGNKYTVDSTLDEVNKKLLSENEAREAMASAVSEFARQLIKGDGTNGEFVGLEKYCKDAGLVYNQEFDLSGVFTEETAMQFLLYFNKLKGQLNVDANAIYASRDLISTFETIGALLNRPTQVITIGKVNYSTFLDIPLIPIDNTVMTEYVGDVANGLDVGDSYQDFYLARLDVNNGIFCGSPVNKGAFVKVTKPVENGSPIATGYVDFPTCLVVKNKKALIKAIVKTVDKA